jgi:glutamyl-tRNA synthetase
MKSVRTRFAPSPTGALHLGAVRTALFAWLFARHSDGQFILRIEDTDQTREVAGATEVIKETLSWLGLDWDEGPDKGGAFGPYVQSERLELYRKYTDVLLETGKAYRCWCSPERLDRLRKEAQAKKVAFKYDRHCLANPGDTNDPHVVRILIPEGDDVVWTDLVKGEVHVARKDIDDFVGLKSDGFPTYHLASVIDDHLMEISHVIRSDEWLASTPKHLLLYEAFDWEVPFFAHVPNVLGEDGRAKLSKRRGAKAVLEYRDAGYLQSALINMMATLGWNDGTEQEIFSVDELIEKFSLERVQKSPAALDERRLLWLNGAHIRELTIDELFERSLPFLPAAANNYSVEYQKQVIGLIQERLKFLAEIPELTSFFFTEPAPDMALINNNKQLKKLEKTELISLLEQSLTGLENSDFSVGDLTNKLNELLEQTGQKPGILFSLIRVATTWAPASPGLADSLAVLGKDTSLERIQKSLNVIANS